MRSGSPVALVISLFALFVALGQLFQQFFATAEGHRRCQEPFIGLWAHWTARKFLVHGDNEMPHEILGQLGALYITHHRIPGASNSSLPSVFKPKPQIISLTSVQFTPRNELVCWMSLLDQLRQMAEYSTPKGRYCGIHSWSPQIASPLEVRMSIPAFSREGFLVGELLKTPAVIFRERSWDFMP